MPRNRGRTVVSSPPPRFPFLNFNVWKIGAGITGFASNVVSGHIALIWGVWLSLLGLVLLLFGLSPVENWLKNNFKHHPVKAIGLTLVLASIIFGPFSVRLRDWTQSSPKPIQAVQPAAPYRAPAATTNAQTKQPMHELPPECRYTVVCMEGGAENQAYGNVGRVVLKGEHGSRAYGNVLPVPGATVNNAPNGTIVTGGYNNRPTVNNGAAEASRDKK